MKSSGTWILGVLCGLVPVIGWTQEPPAKDAAKPAAETIEVKAAPLSIFETLKARVESTQAAEIKTNMDVLAAMVVEQVVPPGTVVKKGDVVLKFKTDKIEQQLQDAQHELAMAELSLKEAEANLAQVLKTYDMDHALAQQKWDHLQQDVDYYFKVSAPLAERQLQKRLESSEFQVEYAQDELDQLEKMYKEDELTEESELIVLKRAKRSLDQSKFFLESTKIDVDHTKQVEFPREAELQKKSLERGELEFKRAMISLPSQRQLKEMEMQKQKFAYDKQARDLAKLQSDFEKMSLRAPVDGVVYHGQCRRGTWGNVAGGASRVIEPGASLNKDIVAITIVPVGTYQLRSELDEKQIAWGNIGFAGVAMPTTVPSATFDVKIREVGTVPVEEGKFDCQIAADKLPDWLVPGMTCEVKFPTYAKQDAMLVPKASVFSDNEGLSHYVFVSAAAGPERREVKVGKSKDDKLEIVSGLKAGEKILKAKPE